MDWANKIKELRLKLLLTQTEFGELVGVGFTSINRYENGKCMPTMKVKRKFKELFEKYGIKMD